MGENEIVLACQNGNSESFWILYEKYFDAIYRFVFRKTSNTESTQDLCSDIFMKCFQNISKFQAAKADSNFRAWLYTIAQNSVVDYYRTLREHETIEEVQEIPYDSEISKLIDDKDTLKRVKDYLQTLKPKHREIILLRIWDDLSYQEIATLTQESESNCKKVVSRTLQKLTYCEIALLLFLLLPISSLFSSHL